MTDTQAKSKRRLRTAWRLLAVAASAATMTPAAHATNFVETADFSNDPTNPTLLGGLTLGGNLINGTINTFGTPVGPHGERTNQDMDYVTFTVPRGYTLSQFVVASGTSIFTTANSPSDGPARNDSLFLGLYANPYTPVDPSFTSAAGLLGWTLVTQAQLGTNILPAIGAATAPGFPVPGATGFTGPLGAGTYTLWLYDGDEAATYSFNLVATTAAVPEPSLWATMILGFGLIGYGLRRRSRQATRIGYA